MVFIGGGIVVHHGGAVGGRTEAPRLPDDVKAGLPAPVGECLAKFHWRAGFAGKVAMQPKILGWRASWGSRVLVSKIN